MPCEALSKHESKSQHIEIHTKILTLLQNVMKQERSSDSRLDGSVMQVAGQNNVDMGMMNNMSLITIAASGEQQLTSVPMDTSGTVVQVVSSDQTIEEEVESEEENYGDGCDNDDGMKQLFSLFPQSINYEIFKIRKKSDCTSRY